LAQARLVKMDEGSIRQAAEAVSNGGLVAYPTDTVYGLGCDPFNTTAVGKLVKAKRRVKSGLPVLVDGSETAKKLGQFSPVAVQLANNFWPGGLTLVVPSALDFPPNLLSGGFVGLRVPDRADTLRLVQACGSSLVGTSANISGMPSAVTADEVLASLGGEIDLVLDGGPCDSGKVSTVVRVTSDGCVVLRKGVITVESIGRSSEIVKTE
jgi:L-threonylcarbamoyladenylate synthase